MLVLIFAFWKCCLLLPLTTCKIFFLFSYDVTPDIFPSPLLLPPLSALLLLPPWPPLLSFSSSFMLYMVYRFSWMWRLMSFNSLGQFCTFISSNIASVLFSPFFFQDFFHYEIKNIFLLFSHDWKYLIYLYFPQIFRFTICFAILHCTNSILYIYCF